MNKLAIYLLPVAMLLAVPAAQASWPYVNNGTDAQMTFQQSERTSPPNPGDKLDWNLQAIDPGQAQHPWGPTYSDWCTSWTNQQNQCPVIETDQGGVPNATIGATAQGVRYLQQIGPGLLWKQGTGWGFDFLNGTQDNMFINYFPSSRYANRLSFIVQAPDQAYLPDGSVADVTKNPVAYLNAVSYETADFEKADGEGWLNYAQESDNWHFYWGAGGGWVPSVYWATQAGYNLKVESLGNHFQRITISGGGIGERTSATHVAGGTSDPITPDMAAFNGDRGAMMRNEDDNYIDVQGTAHFVNQDPSGTSTDIFTKGIPVWRMYGFSDWYEDDGVDILGYNSEYPAGSPFLQVLLSTSGPQFLNIPFTIHNHSSQAYSYLLALPFGNSPVLDPSTPNASGVTLYTDPNNTGVPNPANALGSPSPVIAAGGTLHCIAQIDTTQLAVNAYDERSVEVHVIDPSDPMTLKHANLMIETYVTTSTTAGMCNDNIFFYGNDGSTPGMPCPPNPIPVAGFTVNGAPVTDGMTMTMPAGIALQLNSTGYKPGSPNGLTVLNSLFYFPDGTSAFQQAGIPVQWTPFMIGNNQPLMMQIGDSKAHGFLAINLNVTRGSGAPVAKINVPTAADQYYVGQPAYFAAYADPVDNYSPSGGGSGTTYGIASFNWTFGDGQTATNTEYPVHVYATPGTYQVTLTDINDQGTSTSVSTNVVILPPEPPPSAQITLINSSQYMQYGMVGVTGVNSTPNDMNQYIWSFTGPSGYTDQTNVTYNDQSPQFFFSAWYAGSYQVNLTVLDQFGVSSSTSITLTVVPWDGTYRGDIFTSIVNPGGNVTNWDAANVQTGWTGTAPGQIPGQMPMQELGAGTGGQPTTIECDAATNVSNTNVPSGTPSNLNAVFVDAEAPTWNSVIATIHNLPKSLYSVTAYLYDSSNAAAGTQYTVSFSTLTLNLTIPSNATYTDFTATGQLVHPGGDLVISGNCNLQNTGHGTECVYPNNPPYSPLAGFTLKPVAGPVPVVSITSPAGNTTAGDPAYLTLSATAFSQDGTITQVNFYANGILIGSGTVDTSGTNYTYAWNNVPTGVYTLTAVAQDNAQQITTSSPLTLTVLPPNPVSLEIKGNASELSSIANGATVTPTVAPAGMTGQAAIVGTGSMAFTPAVSGDGVTFQVNGQQNSNTAFYKFTGAQVGQIFNISQGDMTFYLKSNYDLATRSAGLGHSGVVMDVQDNSQELFSFQTQGFVLYYRTGGTSLLGYTIPAAQQNALFGLGTILKVRLAWDGQNATLFLNDNLVSQQAYTPATPNWTANSIFTFGSEAAFGGGFFCDDDVIADFQVTAPNPNIPWVTITSPNDNAVFGPPPATIPITASAGIGVGSISQVDFYQGTTLLGTATSAPYAFVWNNVPLGTYDLSAKVTAASGATGVSSLVTVTVSNNPPPIISTFTARPAAISSGQFSTLAWAVSGATDTAINQGVGDVTNQTSVTVSPFQTTSYTLTVSNAYGSVTQSVTVTVNGSGGSPGPGPGPGPGSLPMPQISFPSSMPINGTLTIANASVYTGVTFQWTFTPSAVIRQTSGGSSDFETTPLGPGLQSAGATAYTAGTPFQTSAATMQPIAAGLTPETYQVSVVAIDGSGNQSPAATGTVTLVLADLSAVQVYPNPWRSDKHAGKSVTFANLPANCTVKIFTTSGHKAKEFDNASGSVSWDLTNDSGDKVASGVYIYLISDGQGNKVKGKVAVIR